MILDDSAIEAINSKSLKGSPQAAINIHLCNQAIDVLQSLARISDFSTDDDITVLRLGIRVINAAGAAGKCALAGYYQPAVAQIRDIIEIAFLLDLFGRQPDKISRWRTCSEKERKNEFKPFELRVTLDKLDGGTASTRELMYKFYSEHGTHAHPHRVQIISPEMNTMIGPFPSADIITKITIDIAQVTCAATGFMTRVFDAHRISDHAARLAHVQKTLAFALTWTSWQSQANKG